MPAAEPPCAVRSLADGEPLAGTASRVQRWLMVEQPGPWGHDALIQSALDPEIGRELQAFGRRSGVRVLLVKRRDRMNPRPRRCFAAFTGRRERRLVAFEVDRPEDLLALDLDGPAARGWEGFGTPLGGPLFLVCTHGKHDQCCAREGIPVARALATRPNVWEATHVGGDRFAGNIVAFPHGFYFGRVTPATADAVVDSYAGGSIDPRTLRGRAGDPPVVQAAEHHVRSTEGIVGVDDLELIGWEGSGPWTRVRFRSPLGGSHEVWIEEGTAAPRPLTCKATHPHRPRSFRASAGRGPRAAGNHPDGS